MSTLIPVYYQIKQTIKNWLLNKEYKPGQKIPSEKELSEIFRVSKMTVRQAITQLVQEGLLISKRGSGTFVSEKKNITDKFGIEFTGFMDEIFYQVQKAKTKSAVISQIKAPESIRNKLELSQEEPFVLQIKRVRYLEDTAFCYAINYLPIDIGIKIVEEALYHKPLLQILEQDLGILFTEAYQTIEASFSNAEISEKLGIPLGTPMLYIDRVMYTSKKKPVSLLQISYRGDMFKYIGRFKNLRRKKGDLWVHHPIP